MSKQPELRALIRIRHKLTETTDYGECDSLGGSFCYRNG